MSRLAAGDGRAILRRRKPPDAAGVRQIPRVFAQSVPTGHELRCYNDALAYIAEARDKTHLAERITAAFPQGGRSKAFNKLFKVSLYPYQREGALFAAKAGRSLVADDMGLGKTIQAIAAVEILAQTAGVDAC